MARAGYGHSHWLCWSLRTRLLSEASYSCLKLARHTASFLNFVLVFHTAGASAFPGDPSQPHSPASLCIASGSGPSPRHNSAWPPRFSLENPGRAHNQHLACPAKQHSLGGKRDEGALRSAAGRSHWPGRAFASEPKPRRPMPLASELSVEEAASLSPIPVLNTLLLSFFPDQAANLPNLSLWPHCALHVSRGTQ